MKLEKSNSTQHLLHVLEEDMLWNDQAVIDINHQNRVVIFTTESVTGTHHTYFRFTVDTESRWLVCLSRASAQREIKALLNAGGEEWNGRVLISDSDYKILNTAVGA